MSWFGSFPLFIWMCFCLSLLLFLKTNMCMLFHLMMSHISLKRSSLTIPFFLLLIQIRRFSCICLLIHWLFFLISLLLKPSTEFSSCYSFLQFYDTWLVFFVLSILLLKLVGFIPCVALLSLEVIVVKAN